MSASAYLDVDDRLTALRKNLNKEAAARGNTWQNGPRHIDISNKPAPSLSTTDLGFRTSKHFGAEDVKALRFGVKGDSFTVDSRLTMSAATGQFALSLKESSSGSDRRTLYFYNTILQGKFKRVAGNHFKFQTMECATRWQGADGKLFGNNERHMCQFSGEVTQDKDSGSPVKVHLTFLSRGPWDKLEARDHITVMDSVPSIEFGGWFLAEDADASDMNGRELSHSEQGPNGIAGRTGQTLEGVIPYSEVSSLGY
eukprot:TRINITY_DN11618_c0_g1_i2.p1 TRINITY_DN11618_c0_g1~~TRINITY_DN11618_c0_g1_i2.p1  ORF type:complete len:255 (+),score=46.34 TRINITY_DN11618_c0_g1_i2:124-888(+)